MLLQRLEDDTFVLILEPLHGVFLGHTMLISNSTRADLSFRHTVARSHEDDEKVHTENSSCWIVLDTKIDVLINSKSEAASVGEVLLLQLVFLDFQTAVQDFVGLETSHLHVLFQIEWKENINPVIPIVLYEIS